MKTLKFTFFLLMLSLNMFAQSQSKVIAVVTKADWCPSCKSHGPRVVTEILPLYNEKSVTIVVNDLTNNETKKSSNQILSNFGIQKVTAKNNETGVITFINATTKKKISSISVAKSNDEIKAEFDKAIAKM